MRSERRQLLGGNLLMSLSTAVKTLNLTVEYMFQLEAYI